MGTPKISLTSNLQKLIDKMQFSDCCIAKDRVQFLDSLIALVVTDADAIGELDKDQHAALVEMLSIIKTEYQSFIPEWEPKLEV